MKEFWPSKLKSNNIVKINECTADTEKANILNEYFSTIDVKLASKINSDDDFNVYIEHNAPIFDIKPVYLKTIAEAVRDIKPLTFFGGRDSFLM